MRPDQPTYTGSRFCKRAQRACDQCRKLKIRCEAPKPQEEEDSKRCHSCFLSGTGCTYIAPVHKRGPPKGYLSALEQRLNDAEALLGAIICSKDPRATSLTADLSKDSLASAIIDRVTNSEFGPVGRATIARSKALHPSADLRRQQKQMEQPPYSIDTKGHLVFTSPSNTWQDYLDLRIALEAKSRSNTSLSDPVRELSSKQSEDTGSTSLNTCATRKDSDSSSGTETVSANMDLCDEMNTWLSSEMMVVQYQNDTDDTESAENSSSQGDFNFGDHYDFSSDIVKDPDTLPYDALAAVLGVDTQYWQFHDST